MTVITLSTVEYDEVRPLTDRSRVFVMINPHVEDFCEFVSGAGTTLDLAEIRVSPESPYANHALSDTDFRSRGVIIVANRRPEGEVLLPPSGSTTIRPDDVLIALGKVAAVSELLACECEDASL